jgi:organic hydroperoxide reductase OsmC/OhrA
MVVIASRQQGQRPETIRTRLARFMPIRAVAGWSVAWAANTDRAEEISSEDELAATEHLGCYGAAVAHALAAAEVAPVRVRVTAEALAATDDKPQPITLEVRAQIAGPALDPTIFESLVRRAEPACAVWQTLASADRLRIVALLDDPAAPEGAAAPGARSAAKGAPAAPRPKSTGFGLAKLLFGR